ncbi:TIGR02186 family protein [Aestuariispira insulae]|uniref:Uncharacterized protein (TIGR02186 family) n=1 Tax=Aestuariispira insulae TaxID=1461337 RepID=A0A3D9HWJ8_9PROT|nr:TIGR02186 family protein [Aestuariispira insulae]RED53884.1 uncharacterized protein (TIGR02186 family) [Aestuariispira insulae]
MLMYRFLLALTLMLFLPLSARAESLVADLSEHMVAITTGFTGTELLLFGAVDGDGDIVVVTHGPTEEVVVRKKDRVAGIWMNTQAVTFEHVPSFYQIAETEGAVNAMALSMKRRHKVGVRHLRMDYQETPLEDYQIRPFREALIRNKQRMELYSEEPGLIERRGKNLFRTEVFFPTNIPTGTYIIETLLVKDGEVVSAQTTPLFINKLGLGARIFRFANVYPASYGIAAILIAVLAGLFANWIFRKLS